jgi:sugar phosphate isomerase/epimerase
MKFAICQELFEDWDWERQCRFIAEVGYTGIEVAPFTLAGRIEEVSPQRRRELRQQAEAHGLSIIGLHWLLAKTEGLHLTSADPVVRRATAAYLVELTHACADLGGELLVLGSPKQRDLALGMTHEEGVDHAEEIFRAILPALDERHVRLCLEPLTPKETNFLNTCAQAQALIDRIGHPNLILHQDVKAMRGAETQSVPALIAEYAGRVGHFHANDTNLLGPGMGETDFVPIFSALLRAAYSGWVSVEVFDYRPGCERIARESFRAMQDALTRASA